MTERVTRTPCGSLRAGDAGKTVLLRGWVDRRRDHGDLVFVDLRDRSGFVQAVFDPELMPDRSLLEFAKELRSEFVVELSGEVVRRDAAALNAAMPTGEVEVRVTRGALLARSETPPFAVEDGIKWSDAEDNTLDELGY